MSKDGPAEEQAGATPMGEEEEGAAPGGPKKNPLEDYRCFPKINEAWELVKTGLIVIDEKMYRLEIGVTRCGNFFGR